MKFLTSVWTKVPFYTVLKSFLAFLWGKLTRRKTHCCVWREEYNDWYEASRFMSPYSLLTPKLYLNILSVHTTTCASLPQGSLCKSPSNHCVQLNYSLSNGCLVLSTLSVLTSLTLSTHEIKRQCFYCTLNNEQWWKSPRNL